MASREHANRRSHGANEKLRSTARRTSFLRARFRKRNSADSPSKQSLPAPPEGATDEAISMPDKKIDWPLIATVFGTLLTVTVGNGVSLYVATLNTSATTQSTVMQANSTLQAKLIETKGSFDAKMVEIGVNILSADPGKDVKPARAWAIDLVEQHSGLRFNPADRNDLLHHAISMSPAQLPQFAPRMFSVNGHGLSDESLSCDKWKRNADGSWTSIVPIIDRGLHLGDITAGPGLEEALRLEAKCGAAAKH